MRWPWRIERRSQQPGGAPYEAPYTDAVVARIQEQASGVSAIDAAALASLETAAGLYARAFASAEVTPRSSATEALAPALLALIGRELVRRGECVLVIAVERGRLLIQPAGSWDVQGPADESRWLYRVDLFGASTHSTRLVPGESVIHPRYAVRPSRPWAGVSPVAWCGETAALAARLERHVNTDLQGPVGQVGGYAGNEAQLSEVTAAVRQLRGSVALVSGGSPLAQGAASDARLQLTRVGADPAQTIPMLREQATVAVLAACGVPPELATGAAESARREAWRQFMHGTIAPVGRIVEAELARKLDEPDLSLSFDGMMASDVTGRARAWRSLAGKEATMNPADASRLVGFDVRPNEP